MKPHFHKVPTNTEHSFSIRHDVKPNFGTVWHYHPELELHYVIKGEGVRFIGDNVSNFSSDEVLLLGENLPHTWRCNAKYFQGNQDIQVEAIVMQFRPDCMGNEFLNLSEAFAIKKLYDKAKKGLFIKGQTAQQIKNLLQSALSASALQRLIILLSILELLTESDEMEMITDANTFYQSNEMETVRLNNVCSYTLANYAKDIRLEDIAAIANLSTTSFCRYFKLMTHKTYNDFLTEIRVSHACRALVENRLSIEIICFESGFNNLSNFYRHFKNVKGTTPLEYKKKYLKSDA
ncbi:AraC family transcriptional regulator [Emticicia sp. 17c]|uniref:AraC family transcriptional regulator n=1 Tax=Emticicia sp. 17c TaxID=3127704 RepID=UPI00301BBDF2